MEYPHDLPGELPSIEGEEGWKTVHNHWIEVVRHLFMAGVVLIVIVVMNVLLGAVLDGQTRLILTLGGLAIVGLLILFAFERWRVDVLVITNKRLISLNGVGPRTVKMFMLDNVMYIFVRQPGLGRIFDYARLEVVAPGGKGEEVMQRAPHPYQLSALIMELSRAK
jgi:hypothetical protein